MSDRKTTEIKLRVTPEEKTRWQVEADRQGVSLSELIRASLGLVSYTGTLKAPTQNPFVAPSACYLDSGRPCNCTGECMKTSNTPQTDVPTSGEMGSVRSTSQKKWMYNPGARLGG